MTEESMNVASLTSTTTSSLLITRTSNSSWRSSRVARSCSFAGQLDDYRTGSGVQNVYMLQHKHDRLLPLASIALTDNLPVEIRSGPNRRPAWAESGAEPHQGRSGAVTLI